MIIQYGYSLYASNPGAGNKTKCVRSLKDFMKTLNQVQLSMFTLAQLELKRKTK